MICEFSKCSNTLYIQPLKVLEAIVDDAGGKFRHQSVIVVAFVVKTVNNIVVTQSDDLCVEFWARATNGTMVGQGIEDIEQKCSVGDLESHLNGEQRHIALQQVLDANIFRVVAGQQEAEALERAIKVTLLKTRYRGNTLELL